MKTVPAKTKKHAREARTPGVSELIITPDGRILAHYLTPALAGTLNAVGVPNPVGQMRTGDGRLNEGETIRKRGG
jgi:hypothetical protein